MEILKSANPGKKWPQDLINAAESQRNMCDSRAEFNHIQDSPSDYCLSLPNFILTSDVYKRYLDSEWYSFVNKPIPIEKTFDLHDDVHTYAIMCSNYEVVKSLGQSPDSRDRYSSDKHHQLLLLGTGDGYALQWLISSLNPEHLVICVDEWSEFISSFWNIEWHKIWTHFNAEGKTIKIIKVNKKEDLINGLLSNSQIYLDHTWIYKNSHQALKCQEYITEFMKDEAANLFYYLGYTIDEYNMILNTAETLTQKPRIFRKPIKDLVGEMPCILCASGPSLDDSLDHIKELSFSHLIIAGGSSVKTLLKAGIRVDFVTLVERALSMEEIFAEALEYSNGHTPRLLMSSTCPSGLVHSYKNTCLFYRPALTPLSLFSKSENEVISCEGPEAINTALSFAILIGAKKVLFFGTDLGATGLDKTRSSDAAGPSPRDYGETEIGVDGELIYTNKIFRDTRRVLETAIQVTKMDDSNPIDFINLSKGLLIKGTQASSFEEYSKNHSLNTPIDTSALCGWWDALPKYTYDRMKAQWASKHPRKSIFDQFNVLREIILADEEWMFTVKKITGEMDLNVSLKKQFVRRVIRSTVIKTALMIFQQMRMFQNPETRKLYILQMKTHFISLLGNMEIELYALCDYVETRHMIK